MGYLLALVLYLRFSWWYFKENFDWNEWNHLESLWSYWKWTLKESNYEEMHKVRQVHTKVSIRDCAGGCWFAGVSARLSRCPAQRRRMLPECFFQLGGDCFALIWQVGLIDFDWRPVSRPLLNWRASVHWQLDPC